MKKSLFILFVFTIFTVFLTSCESLSKKKSAILEQNQTEVNQQTLNEVQPAPKITWSLERDNLIKRFKLQNDRAVSFFMYIFIEGIADPIGYYHVNKVSSVNSQLTNTQQIIKNSNYESGNYSVLPSPAEDGSYGENGDAIFGFTPEGVYIETNMKYLTSTVPLSFRSPVNLLAIITSDEAKKMLEISKKAMN